MEKQDIDIWSRKFKTIVWNKGQLRNRNTNISTLTNLPSGQMITVLDFILGFGNWELILQQNIQQNNSTKYLKPNTMTNFLYYLSHLKF